MKLKLKRLPKRFADVLSEEEKWKIITGSGAVELKCPKCGKELEIEDIGIQIEPPLTYQLKEKNLEQLDVSFLSTMRCLECGTLVKLQFKRVKATSSNVLEAEEVVECEIEDGERGK